MARELRVGWLAPKAARSRKRDVPTVTRVKQDLFEPGASASTGSRVGKLPSLSEIEGEEVNDEYGDPDDDHGF